MKKITVVTIGLVFLCKLVFAQPLTHKKEFTHQDTLRGSINPERAWWDVMRYDITVVPDYAAKSIRGEVTITYKVIAAATAAPSMQIDLQEPMEITGIHQGKSELTYKREGNVYHVKAAANGNASTNKITILFKGNPRIAVNPPWDGGWIFTKDAKGRPWMTVACQGLGASVWYPCKDHQSDEPDHGATLSITIPDSLVAVGNGRLIGKKSNDKGLTTWQWEVKNPINNYTIIPYIGKYVNWKEVYQGEKGALDCSYWALDYDVEKAKKQFVQVREMLKCFEYWMGPYPFYEDGYKLIEAPHLGMEHQSAVAYGNKFMNGYLGRDLSGTGWGKKWDYIIVHESGHEWFGNNITANDDADMWIQEGFTCFSETLFVECQSGKEAADEYTRGLRGGITNDKNVIGIYGVNQEGSSDMYDKGNNLIQTIRQVIDNDSLFRQILRGLNQVFYHRTIDSKDLEAYISEKSGKDFSKVFDQYLRTVKIPSLVYKSSGDSLSYHWENTVDGFNMPVKLAGGQWLEVSQDWKTIPATDEMKKGISADKNFYITVKKSS